MHAAQSPQHQMNIPGNNNNNGAQQQQQQQQQTQASNRKLSQSSAGSNNSSSHRNRSTTPKTSSSTSNQRNTVTPGAVGVAAQQQRARVATPVNQLPSPNNQATMGGQQHNANASQQLHGSHGVLQHNQHQNLHLQQMQQFGHLGAPAMIHGHHAATTHAHHQAAAHHSMQQSNYLPVPPPPSHMSGQNYGAQSPNSFNSMSSAMPPSVIQNRPNNGATANNISHGNSLSTQNPLASPHGRMGPSPSSCAVASGGNASSVSGAVGSVASAVASTGSNFYMQNNNVGHHAPTPSPSIQQAPTPTPQQMQAANMNLGAGGNVANATGGGGGVAVSGHNQMSSLSKLQQLTNGLEMTQQPCNTPPAVHMNLTPPPNHHPHATMTPPPVSHLATGGVGQQANPARTLSTPPASALQSQLNYHHKYYPGNMNVTSSSPSLMSGSSNSSRLVRNTPSAPAPSLNNMGGGIGSGLPGPPSGSSRTSPNMTSLGSNLMPPYGSLNGYRMTAAQQTAASYITNSAAGFINNPGQLPVQMMNMQGQYQDPRSTQQYGQYYLPLNGSMRR